MDNIISWSVIASLFWSITVSDAFFQVGHDVRLAGMADAASIRSLAEVAKGISSGDPVLIPVQRSVGSPVVSIAARPDDPDIVAVAEWIKRRGLHGYFPGTAAQALGLGSEDLKVVQRIYKNGYGFSVASSRGGDMLLAVRNVPAHSLAWLLSKSGEVKQTIRSDDVQVVVVPTKQHLG